MFSHDLRTLAAAAWRTPDCSAAGNTLQCRLMNWLTALQAMAGILAMLLLLVAIFAFVAFRRNKARKLEKGRRA